MKVEYLLLLFVGAFLIAGCDSHDEPSDDDTDDGDTPCIVPGGTYLLTGFDPNEIAETSSCDWIYEYGAPEPNGPYPTEIEIEDGLECGRIEGIEIDAPGEYSCGAGSCHEKVKDVYINGRDDGLSGTARWSYEYNFIDGNGNTSGGSCGITYTIEAEKTD